MKSNTGRGFGSVLRRLSARQAVLCALAIASIAVALGITARGQTPPDLRMSADEGNEDPFFAARWFSASSPWNQPIPHGVSLLPGSDGFVAAFAASGLPININRDIWTPAVLYTPSDAPRCTMRFPNWRIEDVPLHPDFEARISYFAARGDTDSSFCIYSSADKSFYNLWAVTSAPSKGGAAVSVGAAAEFPADGAGWWNNVMGPWSGRSSGASYCGGLTRHSELEAGQIDHALAVGFPAQLIRSSTIGEATIFPARTTDGRGTDPARAVPMGARLQLDPSLTSEDLLALGLREADLVLARAMQRYGAYITDSSSVMAIYVESSPGSRAAAVAALSGSWPRAVASHFRFVAPPGTTTLDNRIVVGQPIPEPEGASSNKADEARQCLIPSAD
jgi:hypothetical protein